METKLILLVEDNPRDEILTLRALKKSKIANNVVVAHDGVEALDYLFGRGAYSEPDSHVMPELVLLDLKLPKVDGLQVLQQVRANDRTRRLPIVIFTSSSEEEDLLNSYNLGANSYIRKPIEFEQLVAATTQLGMYWLVLNEAAPAR